MPMEYEPGTHIRTSIEHAAASSQAEYCMGSLQQNPFLTNSVGDLQLSLTATGLHLNLALLTDFTKSEMQLVHITLISSIIMINH